MFNAENGLLSLQTGEMDYIRFGSGNHVLIMIPGVGDGLKTVKGTALPFALLYRSLCKDFTVYVFSRRRDLAPQMSTRDMADDLNLALEALSLSGVSVVGVSQGGMIAQWLAVDHPDKVRHLILTVTMGRPNPTVQNVIGRWLRMAGSGDYKGIMLDTAERSYSEKKLRTARIMYRFLGNIGKPKSFERFRIQAESCIRHDAWELLPQITCPTLILGGTEDQIVSAQASEELAARIPGSKLKMYEGLGHGLYEEAPDFLDQIRQFCL